MNGTEQKPRHWPEINSHKWVLCSYVKFHQGLFKVGLFTTQSLVLGIFRA